MGSLAKCAKLARSWVLQCIRVAAQDDICNIRSVNSTIYLYIYNVNFGG